MMYCLLSLLMLLQTNCFSDKDLKTTKNDLKNSCDNLQNKINSQELNSILIVEAYWELGTCYINLKDIDSTGNALMGFIVHSEDLINYATSSISPNKLLLRAYIKQFELLKKIEYAKVLIQVYWAHRNDYSCRSELYACKISKPLIHAFGQMLPFCNNINDVKKIKFNEKNNIIITDVTCTDGTETYYFAK
jgi:hypothetical protein